MKKLFTLSFHLLPFLASAQVKTDVSRVIVGSVSTISPELAKGLKTARYKVGDYQIALISARPFTSCFYTVTDLSGRVISSGPYVARKTGEVRVINVGVLASQCRVKVVSDCLIANN